MSVLNVSIWHYSYLLQASLNFIANFFLMRNKLPLLQITPKVKKYNHKLQWQKAWQRLHIFGNKGTFFSLIPTLEKKKSPRNTEESAHKCCPVAYLCPCNQDTVHWNIGLGSFLSPGLWYLKQLCPKTVLIKVSVFISKLGLFNGNDFSGRTRIMIRNLLISALNAFIIFLGLFLLKPTLLFNLNGYFPSLCLHPWYIYRLQS